MSSFPNKYRGSQQKPSPQFSSSPTALLPMIPTYALHPVLLLLEAQRVKQDLPLLDGGHSLVYATATKTVLNSTL